MAQHSLRSAGKHRRHPPRLFAAEAKAKRVDTSMDRVQNASFDSPLDRPCAEADRQKLAACDKTMLPLRNRRSESIQFATAPFAACRGVKGAIVVHNTSVSSTDARVVREMSNFSLGGVPHPTERRPQKRLQSAVTVPGFDP
jgi:hypothetical protein